VSNYLTSKKIYYSKLWRYFTNFWSFLLCLYPQN